MDAAEFVARYEQQFNEGSARGDLRGVAALRTEDAQVVWRAPDMPEVSGRLASAGEAIPVGATLRFSEVQRAEDGVVHARLEGEGFPRGAVTGTARFHLEDGRLTRLEIDLDRAVGG